MPGKVNLWRSLSAALFSIFLSPIVHAQWSSGDVLPMMPPIWTSTTVGYVGYSSSGTLNVDYLECSEAYLGFLPGSDGTVNMAQRTPQGAWTIHHGITIGKGGRGTLLAVPTEITLYGGLLSATATLGDDSGSIGAATFDGFGAFWSNSGTMNIGNSGTGTLDVQAGAQVFNSGPCYLGSIAGSSGTATVTGADSNFSVDENDLYVGNFGSGNLYVHSGGRVSDRRGYLGCGANSSGIVTVTGSGSKWTSSESIIVGDRGEGTLTIEDGGEISGFAMIAGAPGSKGTVTLSGAASKWLVGGPGPIGYEGSGTLNILAGAQFGGDGYGIISSLGYRPGSEGTLNVFGNGSRLTADSINVGLAGNGSLNIGDEENPGGTVAAKTLVLAVNNGSSGTCNLSGGGTLLAGTISGRAGQIVNWSDGTIRNYNQFLNLGILASIQLKLAETGRHVIEIDYGRTGSVGAVLSDATTNGSFLKDGEGTLTLAAVNTYTGPTTVKEGRLAITGSILGTSGITVEPAGTLALVKPDAVRANAAIENAGTLSVSDSVSVGAITGTGVTRVLQNGTLTAASLVQDSLILGGTSTVFSGDVTPNDPSAWKWQADAYVGDSSRGEVILSTGAALTCNNGYVGHRTGSVGTVTVVSGGSRWGSAAGLYVGYAGSGTLSVGHGGLVMAKNLRLANDSNSSGTVIIGHGGTLQTATVARGDGTATFQWNDGVIQNYPSSTALTIANNIALKLGAVGVHSFNIDSTCAASVDATLIDATSGGSLTKIGAGPLTLTAVSTYSGWTNIDEGRFNVTGSILNTSAITVGELGILELAKASGSATAATLPIENDGLVLISAGSQMVDTISGSGTTQVNAGTSLTVRSISQDSLVLGAVSANASTAREVSPMNVVPEPGVLALLVTGVLGFVSFTWSRKRCP
jgi:fibronectin-binding autotransporter adhesin